MASRALALSAGQFVRLGEHRFELAEGERILTEYSYKYSLDGFAALAACAGLRVREVWTDRRRLFSVQYLELEGRPREGRPGMAWKRRADGFATATGDGRGAGRTELATNEAR